MVPPPELLRLYSATSRSQLLKKPAASQLRRKIVRVIRAAHHRPAGNVGEAHLPRPLAVLLELRRRNEFDHWQVPQRGLQVLAEREQVALRPAQVFHRDEQLLLPLAQAEHEAGFRIDT